MNFGIVNVITDDEVQTLKEQIYGLKKFWKQRINWHPANDTGSEEDLERYVHYYTLGTTLYMDASDYGFRTYWRSKTITNRVLSLKMGWVYHKLIAALAPEIGPVAFEGELALPGFHIYEFDRHPSPKKHHRCLHMDGQYMHALPFLYKKYGKDIDIKNPLSFTFTITRPGRGSGIAFWGLPEDLQQRAEEYQAKYPHPIIDRYQNLEYVKEIKEQKTIEEPWKYGLFDDDCGPLEQYMPKVFSHTPGHSFWYSGRIIHQMILGDRFSAGDSRITLQGHGLKINGTWRLFW